MDGGSTGQREIKRDKVRETGRKRTTVSLFSLNHNPS